MIKQIWGLRLGVEILGVRVEMPNNEFYDVDIDVYKNKLNLSPKTLPCLSLIEHGDLLVTKDELRGNYLIKDASNNPAVHALIKQFITENGRKDQRVVEKYKRKKLELQQKYYTYLDNKWLPEFADYHLNYFEGNKNIYTSLTQPQQVLVKAYFRWRSKLIFQENRIPKDLRTKPNKTKKLVEIMGNATDWIYDGTVDTGYKGGSYCDLGHPLRYEHYAVSPSTSRQVIFGATCMSDFFQLDESVLKSIIKAQEILLKEIKAVVFVIDTGKYDQYALQYSDFKDIYNFYKTNKNSCTKSDIEWLSFMNKFYDANLPLTRSMVLKLKDYRGSMKTVTNKVALEERINQVKRDLSDYPTQLVSGVLGDTYDIELADAIKLHLLLGDYTNSIVTDGLKLLPSLLVIKDVLDEKSIPIRRLKDKSLERHDFIIESGEKRLPYRDERVTRDHNTVRESIIGNTKAESLSLLCDFLQPADKLKLTKVPETLSIRSKTMNTKFNTSKERLAKAVKWGMSTEFLEDLDALFTSVILKDKPRNISTAPKGKLIEKYEFIEANLAKLPESDRKIFYRLPSIEDLDMRDKPIINELHYRIALKLGIIAPPKQEELEDILESSEDIFEESNNQPVYKPSTTTADPEDVDSIIQVIERAGELGVLRKENFVFKIIETVKKTGKISPKQQKYVDDALKWINKQS